MGRDENKGVSNSISCKKNSRQTQHLVATRVERNIILVSAHTRTCARARARALSANQIVALA